MPDDDPMRRWARRVPGPAARPPLCVVAGMLCEVRIWTEAERAAARSGARPVVEREVPGLGWVVAVPVGSE